MNRFHLSSAWHGGKIFLDCSVEVDEAGRALTVRGRKGFIKKREVVLARVSYDELTPVALEGGRVRVGDLTLAADDEHAARAIMALVRNPAEVEAKRERERELAAAEEAVRQFLRFREEVLGSLARVREDPRGAMLGLSSLWTDEAREPLEQVYGEYSSGLSGRFEQMNAALASLEAGQGAPAVERLCALAYAVGVVQDALFAGTGDELARGTGLLTELGVQAGALQPLSLGTVAEKVLQAAGRVS